MRYKMLLLLFALLKSSSCWVDYDVPVDRNNPITWSNNLPEDRERIDKSSPNYDAYSYKSEEFALFTNKHDDHLYSCIKLNPSTHECEVSVLQWSSLRVHAHVKEGYRVGKSDVLIGVIEGEETLTHAFDVEVFGTPYASYLINDESYLKVVMISADTFLEDSSNKFQQVLKISDHNDNCKDYRPKGKTTAANIMSTAFYINYFHDIRYKVFPYFFIKKDSHVCIYRFGNTDEFTQWRKDDRHLFEFYMIENYPTTNYAPNFFAIDPLYGSFVSLFWDKMPGNPPEAHFFEFIENEPAIFNTTPIYKFALSHFDEGVLKDIFDEKYDEAYFPVFKSYGRQVFVSFKRESESYEFSGLWKNDTTYFLMPRRLDNFRKVVHFRKDFIQVWKPARPFDRDAGSTTKGTTTTSTSTSTTVPVSSTTETSLPPTDESSTETTLPSTSYEVPSNSISTTLPSQNNPDVDSDYGNEAGGDGSQANEGESDECNHIYLWLMILFVFLDIVLFIILIILIIITAVGAKKRKPKSGKHGKKRKRSKHSRPKAPILLSRTIVLKGKKKKDKSIPSTKDDETADSTVDKNTGTVATVDQSKYYTIDTTFDHTVAKKK